MVTTCHYVIHFRLPAGVTGTSELEAWLKPVSSLLAAKMVSQPFSLFSDEYGEDEKEMALLWLEQLPVKQLIIKYGNTYGSYKILNQSVGE